eukprot:scaffold13326_cov204-Alexandrium_tamarense.AAC.32
MAKKAILEVLENTIGRYVQNLDAESLNVAIWSGKIQLQSLQLNTNAINTELSQRAHERPNLASPFRVSGGKFENVTLDIQWAKLTSAPVVFRARGLWVEVEPFNFLGEENGVGEADCDTRSNDPTASSTVHDFITQERIEAISRAEVDRKKASAVRAAWEETDSYAIQDDDGGSIVGKKTKHESTFLSSLVTRIVENLQIEIEDVHIAVRGNGCAAGLVLGSLSLATTDSHGERTFVDRQTTPSSFLYKELLINGLGIYLQSDAGDRNGKVSVQELQRSGKMEHILSPLSFQAKLRKSDSDHGLEIPKYLVHSKLSSLSLQLTRSQLELGHQLTMSVVSNTALRPLFPEYRPLVPVAGNAKQWWLYAVKCIGRLNSRRSWTEFYQAFKKRKAYINLYKRNAHSEGAPWLSKLSEAEMRHLETIENDRSISVSTLLHWRNYADGRVEIERTKHITNPKALPSPKRRPSPDEKDHVFLDVERSITLTVEEMKALDALAIEQTDQVIAKHSMLCDIDFSLGSFKVNLVSENNAPLMSLEMEKVSTSFKASSDGSFKFGVAMLRLEVLDSVTKGTFYQRICRSLQSAQSPSKQAFEFRLKKTKEGNQSLTMKMVAFEMVASPFLLLGLKEFVTLKSGEQVTFNGSLEEATTTDAFSSALIDAWNEKKEKKQKWKMDIDISAPILILPENCVERNATALICNFGHFKIVYGGYDALSPAVSEWFGSKMEHEIDSAKLEMNELSFSITTVGDAASKGVDGLKVSNSIISPISFTLDIGLEHTSSGCITPRTCAIGVLPAVILHLSPSHVTRMLTVAAVWVSTLNEMRGVIVVDAEPSLPSTPSSKRNTSQKTSHSDISAAMESMYMSLSLLRLSINVYTNNGDGVEAHLVSVVCCHSISSDGSSTSRLKVGWFWILDHMHYEARYPRRQRLVCHSTLPRCADEYTKGNRFGAIFGDIKRLGALKSNYAGSAQLADVSILKLPSKKARDYHSQVTQFSKGLLEALPVVDDATLVNAKFASLYINWNPHASQTFFSAKTTLSDFTNNALSTYEHIPILQREYQDKSVDESTGLTAATPSSSFLFVELKSFELALRSEQDDLPLFTLTMSDSKINHIGIQDGSAEMNFSLGDFKLETPDVGRTLTPYRTILGLAPEITTSLLTVKYCAGEISVQSCNVDGVDKSKCEACAVVILSPMRFVYLQLQIFTLVKYVSDGVFGAMAGSVASAAGAAALEVAKGSENGETLFYVVASGFDFVLPQSPLSEKYLLFHAGMLKAHYRILVNDSGAEVEVSLQDVLLHCDQQMKMVSTPVNLSVSVEMKPPHAPGTADDNAMRVDIGTSRINLVLTHSHYVQIIHTSESNIGEQDDFLRSKITRQHIESTGMEETRLLRNSFIESAMQSVRDMSFLDGNRGGEVTRMFINFKFEELSLELCDGEDPIINIAAVNTRIQMKFLPEEDKTTTHISMHDLVCEDKRVWSMNGTFRRLVGRVDDETLIEQPALFSLEHVSEDVSDISNMKIGSYQVVVLPDLIQELLHFFTVPDQRAKKSIPMDTDADADTDTSMEVVVADAEGGVETAYQQSVEVWQPQLRNSSFDVEALNIQLVLVDLGSVGSLSKSAPVLTETIVMQGQMKVNFEMITDIARGMATENECKIDAERVEIYTAKGVDLRHPVQLLEPAKLSASYYQKAGRNGDADLIELKFATLSPVDLTISMQNMALMQALISSIVGSFGDDRAQDGTFDDDFHALSNAESDRIEQIESSLEKESGHDLPIHQHSKHPDVSVHLDPQLVKPKTKIHVKVTLSETKVTVANDFQGMDEAVFKVTMMHYLLSGEIDHEGEGDSGKPTFGCDLNTRQFSLL